MESDNSAAKCKCCGHEVTQRSEPAQLYRWACNQGCRCLMVGCVLDTDKFDEVYKEAGKHE